MTGGPPLLNGYSQGAKIKIIGGVPWSLFIFPIAIWLYKSRRQLAQETLFIL